MKKIKRLETYNKIFGSTLFRSENEKKEKTLKTRKRLIKKDSDIFNISKKEPERNFSLPRKTKNSDIFNLDISLNKCFRGVSENTLRYIESDIFFCKTERENKKNNKELISIENNDDNCEDIIKDSISKKNIEKLSRNSQLQYSKTNTIKMPNFNIKKVLNKEKNEYNPEKYYSKKTAFERQIDNLYNENYNSYSSRNIKVKNMKSSFGYNIKENYYNPERNIKYKETLNKRHERIKNDFYTESNRFDPNLTSRENYKKGFCSMILKDMKENSNKMKNIKNIKKNNIIKKVRKDNKNVNNNNHNLNNICKWRAKLDWKDNTEIIFKNNDKFKNAHERKFNDQLDNVLYYGKNHLTAIKRNKIKKISLNKINSLNHYKPYISKEMKKLPIYKIKKLSNSQSDFADTYFYEKAYNSARIKPKDIQENNFEICNCSNLDKVIVSKKLGQKGIHYHDLKEESCDCISSNDKKIKFKVRGNSSLDTFRKIREVELELKKEDNNIKIVEMKPIKVNRKINKEIYACNSKMLKNKIESNRLGEIIKKGIYNFNKDTKFSKGYAKINYGYKK